MIAYFDSSALVKLLVDEEGSGEVASLWEGADALASSRVAYAEVRAALAAAQRAGRLDPAQLRDAATVWGNYWDAVRVIEVDASLDEPAGTLAERHALSGFDAIHLASALLLGPDEVVIATWDVRLHDAATAIGYRTLPATIG